MNISDERKIELFEGMFNVITDTLCETYEQAIDRLYICGFTDDEVRQYLHEEQLSEEEIEEMIEQYKDEEFEW